MTPREVSKSVSFRLEAGNVSPLEGMPMLQMSRPPSISPQPPFHPSYPPNVSPQPPQNYTHPYASYQVTATPTPPPPTYAAPVLPQRRSFHQQVSVCYYSFSFFVFVSFNTNHAVDA